MMQAKSQFVVEPKNSFSTEPFCREKVIKGVMQAESQFVVEPKNIFSTEPFRREKVIAPVFFPRTIIQGLDASRIMVWSPAGGQSSKTL